MEPNSVVTWKALGLLILWFGTTEAARSAFERWCWRDDLGLVYDRNGLRRRKD